MKQEKHPINKFRFDMPLNLNMFDEWHKFIEEIKKIFKRKPLTAKPAGNHPSDDFHSAASTSQEETMTSIRERHLFDVIKKNYLYLQI